MLYAILAGLGVFLLHNLVDFAMFEVGPMFLFALLAGSVRSGCGSAERSDGTTRGLVGQASASCRSPPRACSGSPPPAALAVPVLIAEDHAAAGDEHLRTGNARRRRAGVPRRGRRGAVQRRVRVPRRRRPAGRRARPDDARRAFDAAIAANPAHAGYRASRGRFEASLPQPDAARVRAAYDAALALDPANVPMRLDYAAALERLGLRAEAKAQYETALWYNDQLPAVEIERLPPAAWPRSARRSSGSAPKAGRCIGWLCSTGVPPVLHATCRDARAT